MVWAPARGASNYSVQAVTDRGLTDGCNTTGGSCFLHGLQCGQIYNVTVKAHNMACDDGVTSEPQRLTTGTVATNWKHLVGCMSTTTVTTCLHCCPPHPEPCPPTGVTASVDCEQLSATVSWQQSDLALAYMAFFESSGGHRSHCASTGAETQCEVTQLVCGTVYSVWVKALGLQHNSSASEVLSLTSGEDVCQAVFPPRGVLHRETSFCQMGVIENKEFF